MVKKHQHSTKDVAGLIIKLAIIIVIIFISGFAFTRIDLTEEKRHSLTRSTVAMLEELDDVVYVKVYLKGDYPAEFKQLERAVKEKLDEMKAYAGENLKYDFINPSEAIDQQTRLDVYQKLTEQGLKFTSLQIRTNDGVAEKIIFPGALVSYKQNELPLQILKGGFRIPDAQMMNNSINNLEYEFTRIIRLVQEDQNNSIALIEGHGELYGPYIADLTQTLEESYVVERVLVDGKLNSLFERVGDSDYWEIKHDLAIIADPDTSFGDQDMFLIDQYIMHGGKVIWLVDPMIASRDSLRNTTQFLSISKELDIISQLYDYGVRINSDLILDKNCAFIDVQTGQFGDQTKVELFPWFFNPLIISRTSHPIVNNLDFINMDFASSIDTIPKEGVKSTILLTSSENSRILRAPARVNINAVRIDPDFENKKQPYKNVAVLLEGEFKSAFANRISPFYLEQKGLPEVLEKSENTAMMVVSDGDIARNLVDGRKGVIYPLSYDRYAQNEVYGNRDFLLNAINYLLNDQGLISIRSRTIKMRQLNPEKIQSNRTLIQIANVGLPVLLVVLLGLVFPFIKKRRNTK